MPVPLDPGFPAVAEALGDADALTEVPQEALMAVAYASGELPKLLAGTPDDLVTTWEQEIDARGGLEDIGAHADTAYNNAMAAATTEAQRKAVKLVVAKDGKLSLAKVKRSMPAAVGGEVDVSGFPRLAKLNPSTARVSEGRLRSLATRLNVALPAAADLTEGARAQWVTGLALMACSLTARAVAWLALATSDVEWAAAVNELNDGRFSPEWMTARRSERAASVEQERLRRAAGNGFSAALTPIEVIRHVSGAPRAAVVDGTATGDEHKALVTRVARATAQTHAYSLIAADDVMFELAAGTAVLKAMKANNHGLDKLTQAPADAALALQHVLIYVTNALDKAAAAPAAAAGAGAAPFAPTDSAALGESWKQSLVTALDRIAPAAEDAAAKAKTDPIVLGKAPEERGARRPEYFAPVDIEPFYAAEAAFSALSLLHGKEFRDGFAALSDEAKRLAAVPVHHGDLARNSRLLPLDLVYSRANETADNILIKGTVLAGEREGPEQRAEDKARAKLVQHLQHGDVVAGGPHICVVNHKLDSFWVFCQIPYRSGAVAAEVNGAWDAAWMTWAEMADCLLGDACEILPGVERIILFVRKTALTGHHIWAPQSRCDYPGVAMWLFARDYRAYRERRSATKPSLLKILKSDDFAGYLRVAHEWGTQQAIRPTKMPVITPTTHIITTQKK